MLNRQEQHSNTSNCAAARAAAAMRGETMSGSLAPKAAKARREIAASCALKMGERRTQASARGRVISGLVQLSAAQAQRLFVACCASLRGEVDGGV